MLPITEHFFRYSSDLLDLKFWFGCFEYWIHMTYLGLSLVQYVFLSQGLSISKFRICLLVKWGTKMIFFYKFIAKIFPLFNCQVKQPVYVLHRCCNFHINSSCLWMRCNFMKPCVGHDCAKFILILCQHLLGYVHRRFQYIQVRWVVEFLTWSRLQN
jgi:hypothetical protein